MIFSPLVRAWHDEGYGILLGQKRYTHAVYADNIYLFSRSHSQLQAMVSLLTESLAHFKLAWKRSSLKVLSAANVKPPAILLGISEGVVQAESVSELSILGLMVNFKG